MTGCKYEYFYDNFESLGCHIITCLADLYTNWSVLVSSKRWLDVCHVVPVAYPTLYYWCRIDCLGKFIGYIGISVRLDTFYIFSELLYACISFGYWLD